MQDIDEKDTPGSSSDESESESQRVSLPSTTKGSVVVVTQAFPPDKGGNSSRIHDISTKLVEEGWDVDVLAPPSCYPHGEFERTWKLYEKQQVDGVKVHRVWSYQPTSQDPGMLGRLTYYLVFALGAFVWLASHRDQDLVVTSSPPIFTGLAMLPLTYVSETPWVLDVRDLWIEASVSLGFISAGGILERISRYYQGTVVRRSDLITVTTEEMADRLSDTYDGADREEISVVPNGVDTSVFNPGDSQGNQKRRRVVYTGNFGYAQDLENCIRAMVHMGDETVLELVGGGDLKSELRRLADELDLNGKVEFRGFVPREDVPEILREAQVGVAPLSDEDTLSYAVPTKVYEYMACELPVVGVGEGEIEQVVEGSDAGVVVDNDPVEIAGAFESYLYDEEKSQRAGKNGYEEVQQNYDRRSIARNLSERLRELKGENGE